MILITGGAGFVGRHLCAYLAARGGDRVRVLSRHPEWVYEDARHTLAVASRTVDRMGETGTVDPDQIAAARERIERGTPMLQDFVDPLPGDIADVPVLVEAMRGVDAVVHTVAIIRETEGRTFAATNVAGTENVVAAMHEAGVRRFLAIGVMGSVDDERQPYSRSRWLAENVVADSGLDHTVVKPSLVLGHGDAFSKRVISALDFSKPIVTLPNGGKTKFQPIWIGDLVRVLASILENPDAIGRKFEIGGPDQITFSQIAGRFAAILGKRRAFIPVPSQLLVPGAIVLAKLSRDPPVTRTELRELEHDNVTDLDSIQRQFGFAPLALSEYLPDYLSAMTR